MDYIVVEHPYTEHGHERVFMRVPSHRSNNQLVKAAKTVVRENLFSIVVYILRNIF